MPKIMALVKRYRRSANDVVPLWARVGCYIVIAGCLVFLMQHFAVEKLPGPKLLARPLLGAHSSAHAVPPVFYEPVCSDTCHKARDGVCDDGSADSYTRPTAVLCDVGTDCSDCKGPWMRAVVHRCGPPSVAAAGCCCLLLPAAAGCVWHTSGSAR
jgi:hypothetical protein